MTDSPSSRQGSSWARKAVNGSLLLAVAWVIFFWGFWDAGPAALGINAAVWLAGLLGLLLWTLRSNGVSLREHRFWIAPLALIIASYALYDNPFLKTVNTILVLPAIFALMANYAALKDPSKVRWDSVLITKLIIRSVTIVFVFWRSAKMHVRALIATEKKEHETIKRAVLGLLLFFLIAVTVIIPLLSAADASFAASMSKIVEWSRSLIASSVFVKIVFAAFLSIVIVAGLLAWTKPFEYQEKDKAHDKVDAIIAGIVLGGILALYLLFLGIQFRHLWVGGLPAGFLETERFVKSGFWQLLALTALNIVIVFGTYRRTAASVQKILLAFTAASFLLLASAAQRMALYVKVYGLSYEKFFASYAVLFCAVLMIWLIVRMTGRKRVDILKFGFMLCLWMYAVLTVLPVEQMILRSNVALAQMEGSRIRLYELTMLSPDVLGTVREYIEEGKLAETLPFEHSTPEKGRYTAPAGTVHPFWDDWMARQEQQVAEKAWYEHTFMNLAE